MVRSSAGIITLLLAVLLLAVPAWAQETNEPDPADPPEEPPICIPDASAAEGMPLKHVAIMTTCSIWGPGEVQGLHVQCTNATYIEFSIADCCIPGDHWSLKGKNWDVYPNTAVTTSPGPPRIFGSGARVYNYGGTGWNPGNMDTYIECTYLHGVDVFPAGSWVLIRSDGNTCTVAPDVRRSRIDRSP